MNDLTISSEITPSTKTTPSTQVFSFGEPEPVLDGHSMFEYGFCPQYARWYELPFDVQAVAKLFRATSHHTSALVVKRNILTTTFKPHRLMSRQEFSSVVTNLLVFGNGYVQIQRNRLGGIMALKSRPAMYTRRGTEAGRYYQIQSGMNLQEFDYQPNEIIHLYQPDLVQDLYGVPDYLGSVNAILLNEAATLFRRRYYKNGAHAGFILHLSDAMQTQEDVDGLEVSLAESKGAGNFKNLLIYTPGGNKDGVKVIPLAEVAAKDEFYNIKMASRDDQLAGHRIPPQLLGVVPQNAGGFGDIEKAARVFYANEIRPLQNMLLDINALLGLDVISFNTYEMLQPLPTT
jgi:PBSX family phage portal protein